MSVREASATRRQRVIVAVLAIVLVGLAAAGLLRAASTEPASDAQRVEAVAAGLRCPTCQGLSVADSPSKVANGMRDIVAEQLATGRTPEEIRAWFVDRYGEWILLAPPSSGLGRAVWLAPIAALGVGVIAAVAVAMRGRQSRQRISAKLRWVGAVAAFVVAVTVALVAATGPREAGGLPTGDNAASRQQPATVDDLDRLRAAVEREPRDITARIQLAAALLRAGRPADVAEHLQPVLDERPNEPDAILLLGIAQFQQGNPAASSTLERYLEVAPEDHEGRPVVEELLGTP
jgi:cytochrome c-type biogenesis protein CcmH